MVRAWGSRQVAYLLYGLSCLFIVIVTGLFLDRHLGLDHVNRFSKSLSDNPLAVQDTPLLPEPSTPAIPVSADNLQDEYLSETANGTEYRLSFEECSAEYSGLFKEIERSVALQKQHGKITAEDMDLHWKPFGAVRAMIYNQKLRIIEAKFDGNGYQSTRSVAILHQIDRAIRTSPFPLPNIEFSFTVDDIPDGAHAHHTIWSLSRLRIDAEMWLMPDFGYWSWALELVGEYEQIRAEMRQNEVEWERKIPKALWRGAVKTNKEVRQALMDATKGKDWADVNEVTWNTRTTVSGGSKAAAIPIADHCAYQFLINTEGSSYSGRQKYLLNCASISIIHKAEWIEPHHHLMVPAGPNQNFVQVERDFSDLEAKVEELLQDPERAKTIVKNSVATFRDKYSSPTAQYCYWRQLFLSWADVSTAPQPWEIIGTRRRLRGTPFETFV
ncbi:glycosyl transferase family 90-domain-containing protein [Massariosphaeria phaeospora]|uniref:Glycosyl transferase family 90-domain-containing protein n=1 Tax=Massariosphaeria phaeospora TaxID=100035 RepID=A0A7C8IH80_9PLEO|nr:glycosyl transferase family 90-domain-containing protein [Massariosphaeria phaeospora]